MDLQERLTAQGGVVTRAQALACGVSARQMRPGEHLLAKVRHGVYALAEEVAGSNAIGLQVAAERLVTGVDLVAVGATAALLHDLPLLGPAPDRLHLAERKPARPKHHGSSRALDESEVTVAHGVPVTTLARTGVDVARERGYVAGVLTCDAALRRGAPRHELETALGTCVRWPGVEAARRAVNFADGRSESGLESLGRVRFDEHGLPAPDLQVVLGDDEILGRVDHYWAEHRTVGEADGALKYAGVEDLFAEKRREDRLREAGFEVVRYTWDEILRTPEIVVARFLRAFERAARRLVA